MTQMCILFMFSEIRLIVSVSFSGVSSLSYTIRPLWLTTGQTTQSVENPKSVSDDF